MAVGSFFFSAAGTAQNSPELQFRFINSFIQLSLLRSLVGNGTKIKIPFEIKSPLATYKKENFYITSGLV